MHDPKTQAFTIPFPWFKRFSLRKDGSKGDRYWIPFITIWHVDPEKGPGGDDSCGWFMRAYHGDSKVLEKIRSAFEFDWDRAYVPSREDHDEEDGPFQERWYASGFFYPVGRGAGAPVMSVHGIVLNLFFIAAREHFGTYDKAARFMRKNLFEILLFAENPTDSLCDAINRKWAIGTDTPYTSRARNERIKEMASSIYAWIIRKSRPWWKHPRWHVHHWELQIHPWQTFRRWALSRCCKCGKRFHWGETPCTDQWYSRKPGFLQGEEGIYHMRCGSTAAQPRETVS